MRILLQVRTGDDRGAASSTLAAVHVFGNPYAAVCHLLRLTVTACKCSEQAVSTGAEANMKYPSKAALLQRERRLLLVFYAAKIPFSLAGLLSRLLAESRHPGQEQREWISE